MYPVKINDFLEAQSLGRVPVRGDGTIADVVIDSRKVREGSLFFALQGEKTDGRRFVNDAFSRGALCCIVQKKGGPAEVQKPASDPRIVAAASPEAVLAGLGAYLRSRLSCRVIGITGSIGKTTAKDLLAALLASRYRTVKAPASFNNHLGVPLTLSRADARTEMLVAELGANHPGEIATLASCLKPDDGVIVEIAPVHLEGFGSLDGVVEAKGELAEVLPEHGRLFLDASLYGKERFIERARCRVCLFGRGTEFEYQFEGADGSGLRFRLRDAGGFFLPHAARQHLRSAAAAVAVALSLEMDPDRIRRTLREFTMPGLRWNREEIGGTLLISDCYNANPHSVEQAVRSTLQLAGERDVSLVLGDMLELGDAAQRYHAELGRFLAGTSAARVYLLGPAMQTAYQALTAGGFGGHAVHYGDTHDPAFRDALAEEIVRSCTGDAVVLFKASRRFALERIVSRVKELLRGQQTMEEKEKREVSG